MTELVPDVFVGGCINAGFVEHLDTIREAYAWCAAFGDLEVTGLGVFALDDLHPVLAAFAEAVEDEDQETFGEIDDLFPCVVDLHFEVEAGKLLLSQINCQTYEGALDLPL